MADSTNSEQSGTSPSESILPKNLKPWIETCEGIAVVGCFASNVHRVQILCDLAKELNRKVVLYGRSMAQYCATAMEMGHLSARTDLFLTLDEASSYDRKKLLLLCSGTQGEFASSLARLAYDDSKFFKLKSTDRVILSSLKIPGNEVAIHSLINEFAKREIQVVHEREFNLHVTGHAFQDEQSQMIEWLQPQHFLPIHGEARMLRRHAQTAVKVDKNLPTYFLLDGQSLIWDQQRFNVETIPAEPAKRWVKNKFIGDLKSLTIREKKKMAREGLVSLACMVSGRNLMSAPQIEFCGLLCDWQTEDSLRRKIQNEAKLFFQNYAGQSHLQVDDLREGLQALVKRVCKRIVDCKPAVIVHLL